MHGTEAGRQARGQAVSGRVDRQTVCLGWRCGLLAGLTFFFLFDLTWAQLAGAGWLPGLTADRQSGRQEGVCVCGRKRAAAAEQLLVTCCCCCYCCCLLAGPCCSCSCSCSCSLPFTCMCSCRSCTCCSVSELGGRVGLGRGCQNCGDRRTTCDREPRCTGTANEHSTLFSLASSEP